MSVNRQRMFVFVATLCSAALCVAAPLWAQHGLSTASQAGNSPAQQLPIPAMPSFKRPVRLPAVPPQTDDRNHHGAWRGDVPLPGPLAFEPTLGVDRRVASAPQLAPPASAESPQGEPLEQIAPIEADPRIAPLPAEFAPWWATAAGGRLRPAQSAFDVNVNSLIMDALRHSSRIRAISDTPSIAATSIVQAEAEFDVHAFMETKIVRTSIPTGSVLDAGFDVSRLREEDWFYSAGLRRRNHFGGELELSQRFGLRDSNSEFFLPEDQGNARLVLSYNQPLLNGYGRAYNTALIVLADIDTQIAWNQTSGELQEQLLQLTEAFWRMYQQRVLLVQKQRHLERAAVILQRLEKRRDVDSLESQIARAQAAVAVRRAELIRATSSVRNSEALIRSLVNAPRLLADREAELVPMQGPMQDLVHVDLKDALVTAVQNRPEVDTATQEIKAAGVRLGVSQREMLPALDVVLETYVSGLRGDHDVGGSWADQFSKGEPSYTAGLVFEVPLHRRAARARLERRQLELRQLSSRFEATIESLNAEVEVAVREVETAYREFQAKYQSMTAAAADVDYLTRRWELLPGDDRAASFLLEDLLDAQDRLAFEEAGFAHAQVDYTLSHTKLRRSMGTLLQQERIEIRRGHDGCLPHVGFEMAPPPNTHE